MFILIQMNESGAVNTNKNKKSGADFNVQKLSKPKPKPKPKPKKKPKKSKPKRAAPTPNMNSVLSGVDTGLASFMADDMDLGDSILGDVDKNMVMTEDTVDVAPKPTVRSAMEYPKKAKSQGIKGYVLINLLVSENGRVEKVKVLESEPEGVFDEVAVAGVKSWEFKPAQYKGKAVKVWAKQKIRFDFQ